jgi:HEAT repeat protein
MKNIFRNKSILSSLLALAIFTARADEEQDQIAVLRNNSTVQQKWAACQKLRVIGTVNAIAPVAALLTDEQLSQAARQTLDGMPFREVDDVLRNALDKTSGMTKAGIVDSIGWRARPASLPLLTPLLVDADTNVAAAAAIALGRIGGGKANSLLLAALDQAPAPVQVAIEEGLLQSADHMFDSRDSAGAALVYRKLYDAKYPTSIRTSAWRGLVLSDSSHAVGLMNDALSGTDHALERVALKTLREAADPQLIQSCVERWDLLPAEAQLAVISGESKQGTRGVPLVRTATRNPNVQVRVAAWTALGDLDDLESIPALAQAAATAEGTERQAAREALSRMRGPGASEALLAELKKAAGPEKEELLRALGARQDSAVADVLLQNAAEGDESVRLAALASLREIAPSNALVPLLDIAAKADSDDVRAQALEALSAVCQASQDKDAATRTVAQAAAKLPDGRAGAFFPLLAGLGTPEALTALETASRGQDVELAKEAVRALSQWPGAAPAEFLLDVAGAPGDPAVRILALRGAIDVCAAEPSAAKRLAILKRAMSEATRPDETKQALGQIGQIFEPEALQIALKAMDDPAASNEAALAALTIAEKLAASHPPLSQEAASKVLALNKGGEWFTRAWALRAKSSKDIPFIRDWVVCGPFYRTSVIGAMAVFKVPFGPELRDQVIEWKAIPSSDQVNLFELFSGAENCAAYLRTTVIVPEDCSGMLLMGSDDGIKVWLNGKVVHSHNVDRPQTVDDDIAPIQLKKGDNELICKISQGGGGWGACARIVGNDGKPIAGLRVERPTGPAGSLAESE